VGRDDRLSTAGLLALSDEELKNRWLSNRDEVVANFQRRGWYHTLYSDVLRGKKVLDIGAGFGTSSITFAQAGARVTFLDLHETNLKVIARLCGIFGITDFRCVQLVDLDSLKALDDDFDVLLALGSLHHAPWDVMRVETAELIRHLKVGGRWIQLAYPRVRWQREGAPPFTQWGVMTDGEGTPWCEWYDLQKLLALLHPARFDVVLDRDYHNADFNWFDLVYRGMGPVTLDNSRPPPEPTPAPTPGSSLLQRLKGALKVLLGRATPAPVIPLCC